MANGVRTYQIVINGLTESISAVDSLNKQLDVLDKKITALQGKAVNVSAAASSGGGGGSRTSELSDEDKLLKQIEATQSKINQADMADYKVLLDKKNELKELVKEQKSMTAEARLSDNAYANTMLGMKQHLADIKATIQTVDLNDTDTFEKLTKDANELNSKLLEIEKSYGQFGRNVGNYASAAEGFKKLPIEIGGVVQEFDSARQALKALKQEMETLEVKKSLGIITEEESERLKEMIPTVKTLKSTIDDAGKPMDAIMDTMQSIVALAQAGKGIAAFFGLEDTGIEKSIQDLVALQNIMQSLQTLGKQMQTGEGLGKYFAGLNTSVDKVTTKLLAYNKTLLGTGTAANAASIAVKGLGTVLKGVGIGLAITLVSSLMSKLSELFSSSKKVEEQNNRLQQSFDVLVNEINRRNEALDIAQQEGIITEQEKLTEQFNNQVELLSRQIELLQQRASLEGGKVLRGSISENTNIIDPNDMFKMGVTIGTNEWSAALDTQINNIGELNKLYESYTKALKEADEANADWATALTLTNVEIMEGVDYYQKMANQMEKLAFSHYANEVKKLQDAYKDGSISAREYMEKMEELEKAMRVDPAYQNALVHLKELFGEDAEAADGLAKSIDNIFHSLKRLKRKDITDFKNLAEKLMLDNMTEHEKKLYEIAKAEKEALKDVTDATFEAEAKRAMIRQSANNDRKKENERWQKEELDKQKRANEKALSSAKEYARNVDEAEKDLINLRIQNMKEGLRKVITQLEEERKQKLAKVEQSGIMVEERRLEINKLYNKKIEEATKKHLETLQNEYKNKWKDIDDELEKSLQKQAKYIEESTRNTRASADALRGDLFKNVYSYGIQSKGSLTSDTLKDLRIVSRGNPSNELDELGYKVADASKKFTKEINKLVDLERKLSYLENRIAAETYKGLNTDELESDLAKTQKEYEAFYDQLKQLYSGEQINAQKNLLYQESYSDKLVDIAHQRYAAMDLFWQLRKKAEKEALDEEYKASEDAYRKQLEANEKFYTDEKEQIKNHLREQVTELNKALNESRISNDEYNKQLIAINKEAQNKQESLEIQFNKNLIAITDDRANKRKELLEERAKNEAEIESAKLQDILQYYRDYYTALNNLEERQPVLNDWGIINWKETKKNTKELIESYKEIAESLNQERIYITSSDILSDEEKEAALREIDGFMADLGDRLDAAKKFNANMFGEMLDSLMPYIQALGNAIQTIMDANNKYQDYLFDKQQEDLDKQNDILQKKLNEQEDILQKHKSAVDDIENELSSARGDRRQHLIDQLNEEIAAQRRAQAEKEQIEKKEEALKKKQDELDKQRKKAEYNRNLQSILVSGAMTISNAFATQPFVPVGLAMGALATTLTAYQYAMAKKAKPYAKGGLLEGPSHQNGGIPVGNTGIEVEGKEYVIRKKSTRENVPVLDFINKSEKKLTLDDFIDFYATKPRATIKAINNKFANGGVLTTPNVDISSNFDRTIVIKDEGVYQVSVVDINRKQEQVKNIQVLAGL